MNAPLAEDSSSTEAPRVSFAKTLAASLAIALAMAAIAWWAFARLPAHARVPLHWNAAGRVDRYGGPAALFFLPALATGISLLLFFLPMIEPRRGHLLRSNAAYRYVWLAIMLFLAVLHGLSVAAALGQSVAMDRWVPGGIGVLFVVIGNFLGKVRSNFVFGVRTPWTLSSERAWNRTHRLAGWLFVIGGLTLLGAALIGVGGRVTAALLVGWIAVTVVASAAYSYLVWRSDPDRKSTAR